jgi:hypothetical protein
VIWSVQVLSFDYNHDGATDMFNVQVGIANVDHVQEASILLEFSYNVKVGALTLFALLSLVITGVFSVCGKDVSVSLWAMG